MKKVFIFYAATYGNGQTIFNNCITVLSPYVWIAKTYKNKKIDYAMVVFTLCNWKFITDNEYNQLKAAGIPEINFEVKEE